MKKSLLSVVLCVALLITAMGTMLAMPASAANGYDVLKAEYSMNIPGKDPETDPATSTVTDNGDGTVTINFPNNDGSEVAFNVAGLVEGGSNVNDFPCFEISVESNMNFDFCLNDANNNKWIGVWDNWCGAFVPESKPGDSEGIPAGTYDDIKIEMTGYYTYNFGSIPANASIAQVIIVPKGSGKITLKKVQLTDGVVEVDLNTRGDQSGAAWDKVINLIEGEYKDGPAPSKDDPQSSVKVTKNADGSVTYGNTNGMYPCAIYDYTANPIVVNDSAALNLDFTVSAGYKTTIYLFMGDVNNGGSTPDNFNNNTYIWIADPANVVSTELGVGHYSGTIFLQDTESKTIASLEKVDQLKNADGKYVINGMKIYATSMDGSPATDNAVTVNKLELVSLADDAEMPSTTKKEDKTTTTLGQATQGANGNTTTVNNGGSNAGGNSASTGDVSEAALFIVVAAAAAAVVTLSVVSKKAKSR